MPTVGWVALQILNNRFHNPRGLCFVLFLHFSSPRGLCLGVGVGPADWGQGILGSNNSTNSAFSPQLLCGRGQCHEDRGKPCPGNCSVTRKPPSRRGQLRLQPSCAWVAMERDPQVAYRSRIHRAGAPGGPSIHLPHVGIHSFPVKNKHTKNQPIHHPPICQINQHLWNILFMFKVKIKVSRDTVAKE